MEARLAFASGLMAVRKISVVVDVSRSSELIFDIACSCTCSGKHPRIAFANQPGKSIRGAEVRLPERIQRGKEHPTLFRVAKRVKFTRPAGLLFFCSSHARQQFFFFLCSLETSVNECGYPLASFYLEAAISQYGQTRWRFQES